MHTYTPSYLEISTHTLRLDALAVLLAIEVAFTYHNLLFEAYYEAPFY